MEVVLFAMGGFRSCDIREGILDLSKVRFDRLGLLDEVCIGWVSIVI